MSLTVTITIDNQLGKKVQDAAFQLGYLPQPIMTAGAIDIQPQNVPNTTATSHNGGIFSNTPPGTVRGIVCYGVPDNKTQLVIFFTNNSARLMTLAKNITVDTTTVDTAETNGKAVVKGTYVVLNELFDYQFSIETEQSADGKMLNCKVAATNTLKP